MAFEQSQLFLEKGLFQQFITTLRKIILSKTFFFIFFLMKIFFLEITLVSCINDIGRVRSDNEQTMKNGQKTNTESLQSWTAF